MKPNEQAPGAAAVAPDDLLSQIELSVAKRADELARIGGAGAGTDLAYWLRAELEIFERGIASASWGQPAAAR